MPNSHGYIFWSKSPVLCDHGYHFFINHWCYLRRLLRQARALQHLRAQRKHQLGHLYIPQPLRFRLQGQFLTEEFGTFSSTVFKDSVWLHYDSFLSSLVLMYTSALLNSSTDKNLNQPCPVSLSSPISLGLLWFLDPSWQCLLPYILQWCINLWRLQLPKCHLWKLHQPTCSRLHVWHNVQRNTFRESKWGLALQYKKTSGLATV